MIIMLNFNVDKLQKNKERVDEFANIVISSANVFERYEMELFFKGLSKAHINALEKEIIRLLEIDRALASSVRDGVNLRPYEVQDTEFYQKWTNLVDYQSFLREEVIDLLIRMHKLILAISESCVFKNTKSLIGEEASILHLVSTNNHSNAHIKKLADDSYMYSCQFHYDRRPSMRVNNRGNNLVCYACGTKLDAVGYIMEVEKIDRYHALSLLAKIYNIESANNPYTEDDELVKKYTSNYALRKYKRRLEDGKNVAMSKRKTFNNYLAIETYTKRFNTLDRMKKGEKLVASNKDKQKRLILEMQEFDIDKEDRLQM